MSYKTEKGSSNATRTDKAVAGLVHFTVKGRMQWLLYTSPSSYLFSYTLSLDPDLFSTTLTLLCVYMWIQMYKCLRFFPLPLWSASRGSGGKSESVLFDECVQNISFKGIVWFFFYEFGKAMWVRRATYWNDVSVFQVYIPKIMTTVSELFWYVKFSIDKMCQKMSIGSQGN